ncbi:MULTISPECIES: ATP-binding cassette domain-containing protein [Lacticaseibacillus]|uniref:ABC transporter ATP-binding protein n=2 Tax=Lacticaseibacillus TaxID=2759736 RepID=A0AAN1EZT7_LACCA|nr:MULTISPECIES: ABC transporter ATP-binding protein [Lacticaseibacillus]ARY92175.1 ABC transporter ATP-binding protein [Lacticaseibacillus casei]KAB1971227.1 ABC transporter ATP-binding protein [Lacticaseibacillus casei]WLV80082.1 ABC transporter ATP-binding protein [Lacticaseibacillus sp. NCIMB 15473]WNX24041.1 ABC transporter ATP-binding protein [Lacticaseibacillus casei]WNX26815.1 ABC transporter ATP-binding protein [Lacticaseibacillus casei]
MSLTVTKLQKRIANQEVLRNITFSLDPGQVVGLVGPNGIGKTTIFRTVTRQYIADDGTVTLDQHDLTNESPQQAAIFYLDQQHLFFRKYALAKIGTTYALLYPSFDQTAFLHLIKKFGLTGGQRFQSLSKGYQALVMVAMALASQAPYVFLDEPFDGLDVLIRERIVNLVVDAVADGQRTFLIASHNLAELDGLSDRVLFVKDGRISRDLTLENVRQQAVKLQLVFRTKEIPAVIKQHGRILNIRGRVIEVVFPDFTSDVQAALQAEQPVLNESLPLSLSDLFKVEFRKKHAEVG